MFPAFRDGGPFLGLLPFPTGGGGAITLSSAEVSDVTGTDVTFTATSSGSLEGAVFGVEFGVGAYTWAENVPGAASSQTITVDFASYGIAATATVLARIYYNLDPLDDPSTRVYFDVPAYVQSAAQSGTATEGETLTGSNGYIIGTGVTASQKWQFDDSGVPEAWQDIPSATATTYVIAATYIGDTLRYAKGGTVNGTTVYAYSSATSVVQSAESSLLLAAGGTDSLLLAAGGSDKLLLAA